MKLLLLSWSVRPSSKAGAAISNAILTSGGSRVTLVGEKEFSSVKSPGVSYIRTNLFKSLRGYQYFRWGFYVFNVLYISYIVRKKGIDKLLVCFPNEYHVALAFGVKRLCGVEMVTWLHNLYEENMVGYRRFMSIFFEPYIMRKSDKVYSISTAVTEHLRDKYSDVNIDTLLHPYNNLGRFKRARRKCISEKVIISLTGSLHESCKDATIALLKFLRGKEDIFELRVFGGRAKREFTGLNIDLPVNIRFEGFVHDDKFAEALWDCNVHFVPHGLVSSRLSSFELMTIFPTRVIPVLATGDPVLLLAPEESFLYRWFELNDCGLLLKSDLSNFDTLLSKVRRSSYYRQGDNALRSVERFEVENFWDKLKDE